MGCLPPPNAEGALATAVLRIERTAGPVIHHAGLNSLGLIFPALILSAIVAGAPGS